ncbi:uncharacterized protein LOC100644290 [Bombus terrestris]|uniref:Uncharacterized protein LOC100644290 n=1 Tax=Bombus terrestris TaxID=30195 RepID=A0A9B7CVF2_BOMTE|nr:uncharacterized protein LOC100644290 [Bombus terrestris]XP_020718877.2 uncharacterized protein LOC100644290 [Bombus terrestris]XP_048261746.1 uncharacterized protein LOC100644290 [Bombus terrestris]
MCRFQRNRIYVASVSAVIMSQVAVPRVFLYLLAAFLATFSKASSYVPPDDCLKFDVGDIEDYLSNLNFENVPTINMMIGGFKCPVTALPFGALKSDWARLLLLQRAQPKESIFLKKLDRLFRILVIAYFQMEERFDVMQSGFWSISSPTATSVHESTTSTDSKEETKKLDNSIANSRKINKTSVNFAISTFFNNDESSSTIEIERIALSSSDVTSEGKTGNFHTIYNIPLKHHSISEQIDEKRTVTAFVNITNFSERTTDKRKYTEISTLSANESVTINTANNFTRNKNGTNIFTRDELNEGGDDSDADKDINFSTTEFSKETKPIVTGSNAVTARILQTMTSSSYQKLIATSVEKERTTESIAPTIFSATQTNSVRKHGTQKMRKKGDFSVSYDYKVSGFNLGKSKNVNSREIFDVKATSEQSHVYSDKISTNPTESFNQSPSNNRTGGVSQVFEKVPWNSMNSTVSSNEIKEPSIYKNTPFGNKFWNTLVISPKVSSTTVTAEPTLMPQTKGTERYKGNSRKSKKRGSSNTDIEKMFRWFYTFSHSSKNNSVDRGVYIACKGKSHNGKE